MTERKQETERISVPERINGWQIIPGVGSIEYRNSQNSALVYYECHRDDTYTARVQGDALGCKRLGRYETLQGALEAMAGFMRTTDPYGYGLESYDYGDEPGDTIGEFARGKLAEMEGGD